MALTRRGFFSALLASAAALVVGTRIKAAPPPTPSPVRSRKRWIGHS